MQSRLQKGLKRITLFSLLLLFLGSMMAQNGENPFELAPRAGTKEAITKKNITTDTSGEQVEVSTQNELVENPFAITPPAKFKGKTKKKSQAKPANNKPEKAIEKTPGIDVQPPTSEIRIKRLTFSIIIFDLILMAIILTLLRGVFQKSYASFINDNLLSQVFRERQSGNLIPFLLFYFLFFYNLALFLFLLVDHYNISLGLAPLSTFLYILSGVILAFFAKHLLLSVVGYIFPVEQELSKYSFTIMIFGIVMGFLLLPFNLLIAYGPENITKYIIYISFGIIISIYLFRSLRGLFIANKFLWFHKFHFLLYICTVEIAPAIIVLKLILMQT